MFDNIHPKNQRTGHSMVGCPFLLTQNLDRHEDKDTSKNETGDQLRDGYTGTTVEQRSCNESLYPDRTESD